jgi:sugar (pentulose or hexulose) kinase
MRNASPTRRVVAVDLGATSGRVMVAEVGTDVIDMVEVHRFPNAVVEVDGSLHWDIRGLFRELLVGLRAAAATGRVDAVGIDSWAVDYGLIDAQGELFGDPYSYRDARTDGVAGRVLEKLGATELYERTGVQQLPFNTVYQLVAAASKSELGRAATMLLLPDLLGYWLTGAMGAERTNASTTGLYDVRAGEWDRELAAWVGLRPDLLPALRSPGDVLGPLLPTVAESCGLPRDVLVVAVGSHDTASAVVATPMGTEPAAYISSGTWSLVGLELDEPVLTEAARTADFTNEGGVDGTIRFLKNVTGLWVLSESLRKLAATGTRGAELDAVLDGAARAEPLRTLIDINHGSLLSPGDMPARLAALAEAAGEPVPVTPAEVTRCILDSLALAYRRHVRAVQDLAGVPVSVVHVVGGGSRNAFLCQLTADACEMPVLAGPAEASALGNVLVQARAMGVDHLADLSAMRDLVRRTQDVRRFDPRPDLDWTAAESRLPTGRDGVLA